MLRDAAEVMLGTTIVLLGAGLFLLGIFAVGTAIDKGQAAYALGLVSTPIGGMMMAMGFLR